MGSFDRTLAEMYKEVGVEQVCHDHNVAYRRET